MRYSDEGTDAFVDAVDIIRAKMSVLREVQRNVETLRTIAVVTGEYTECGELLVSYMNVVGPQL
jgi:hypothetical protein